MSHNSCNLSHSHRDFSVNQKIVPSWDTIQPLVRSETSWWFRQTVLTFALLVTMLAPKTGIGQTTGETNHVSAAPRTTNPPICDIKSATQKSDTQQWKNRSLNHSQQSVVPGSESPAPSTPASSDVSSIKDQLRLSLSGTPAKSPIPEGAFCRRPDQDSQSPSPNLPLQNQPLQQLPPIAQNVGGRLIIHARGQDFASVLQAVGTASGIDIEMPAQSATDPVFIDVGPVSAKEAVVALMDGAKYNYVIMGSRSDPGAVTRIILSERSNASAIAPLVASVSEAAPNSQPTLYGGQGVQEDAEAVNATPAAQGPTTVPAVVPSSVPTGINVDKLAAQSNKTRGQVLDELQKQQLQLLDSQSSGQPQQ
jgi:hypothetical protein